MSTQARKPDSSSQAQDAIVPNTLFQALVEHSSDVIALLNAEGLVKYVSPSITPIMGYSPEEFVGSHALVIVHPDDLPTMQELFGRIMQSPGVCLSAEYRLRCKDGSWRWFDGAGTNLLDDPQVQAIVGNFHDITERKRTESLLDEQNHVFKMIAQDADLRDVLSYLTRLVERYSSEGVLASILLLDADKKHLRHGAAPSLAPAYNEAIDGIEIGPAVGSCGTAAYTGKPVIVSDIAHDPLWKDFRDLALEHGLRACWSTPILSAEKEVLGTFALYYREPHQPGSSDQHLVEFITRSAAIAIERERQEEERRALVSDLQNQQKWLEAILNLLPVPLLFIEPGTGRVTFANRAADEMAGGVFPQGVPGEEYHTVYYCYDAEGNRIPNENMPGVRVAQGEKLYNFQMDWETPTGRHSLLIDGDVLPGMYGHPATGVIMFQDITRLKQLEQRKDEFISMASHELKTPITSIKGFTQVLLRRLSQRDDPESIRFLQRMDAQLNKLTTLISELLDLSRIQTGKLAYRHEPFDLDKVVAEIVENVQATTTRHQIVIHGKTSALIVGDRDRIGQVLINLLSNAIKYSPDHDKVLVHLKKEGNQAIISVQDFGIGIDEAHQQKIFERFYQVTSPVEKTFPGLGIGLYLSNEIIRQHKGRLWVNSRKGEGATFSFALPVE
ncbi:MAG TPA: ATP-binding protein [Ktedonobacteraceae bacterium]|jgi:PAS domain S-box-containing protein|nr:ATP-binding protein [Ktedonobacteraceae bacterium]